MGSFFGHMDEALFFVYISTWWLYNITKNYFKCIDEGKPYRSEISYPSTIRGRTVHLELILKITFPIIGFLIECIASGLKFIDEHGEFRNHNAMQHMSIYALFIMHGVADLMDYRRLTTMREMKYVTMALAFAWYGGGFYFHSDPSTGKPPLELIIHRLPVVLLFLAALMSFIEVFKRDTVVFQLVRTYMVLTHGTWFTFIPFVLFRPAPFPGNFSNPDWNQDSMANVHFMVTAFGIHLILNLFVIMAAFYLAESYRKCLRCISGSKINGASHHYEKVKLTDAEDPEDGENEL